MDPSPNPGEMNSNLDPGGINSSIYREENEPNSNTEEITRKNSTEDINTSLFLGQIARDSNMHLGETNLTSNLNPNPVELNPNSNSGDNNPNSVELNPNLYSEDPNRKSVYSHTAQDLEAQQTGPYHLEAPQTGPYHPGAPQIGPYHPGAPQTGPYHPGAPYLVSEPDKNPSYLPHPEDNPSFLPSPPPDYFLTPDTIAGARDEVDRQSVNSREHIIRPERRGFSDKVIRNAFMRKAFAILICCFLFTGIVTIVFLKVDPIRKFARDDSDRSLIENHPPHQNSTQDKNQDYIYYLHLNLFLGTSATTILLFFIIFCFTETRRGGRKTVTYIIFLVTYTCSVSLLLGVITSIFRSAEVGEFILISVMICATVCLALIIFNLQTKLIFAMRGPAGLVVAIVVLVLVTAMCLASASHYAGIVCGGVVGLVFGLFVVYDMKLMINERHPWYEVSHLQYVVAALNLYLDTTILCISVVASIFYVVFKCVKKASKRQVAAEDDDD